MAINSFHWCLVRFEHLGISLDGTHRFVAEFFTFFSKWPVVNQLRASRRNWFRTIITSYNCEKTSQSFLHCSSRLHTELQNVVSPVCKQMGGKLIMQWEIDVGSELLLISCDVTHLGLACSNNQLHTPTLDRLRERERLLEALNQNAFCHTYLDFYAYSKCMGFE